ncbi:hypothetical protein ACQR1Y_11600 [Bradyrhizobium sp. HKCCYLRH3099]|uniref:hypothetical protein n=1 Tax=unclassified Bradyrhizobium TaxID=2631580 RepID=UPI003EC03789
MKEESMRLSDEEVCIARDAFIEIIENDELPSTSDLVENLLRLADMIALRSGLQADRVADLLAKLFSARIDDAMAGALPPLS